MGERFRFLPSPQCTVTPLLGSVREPGRMASRIRSFWRGGMVFQSQQSPQGGNSHLRIPGQFGGGQGVAGSLCSLGGSQAQIQNPLLVFALEDAWQIDFSCGDTAIHQARETGKVFNPHTPNLGLDLSRQSFGIIAVAESPIRPAETTIWSKIRSYLGASVAPEATLFSLTILPPGDDAAPAVLSFVVSNKGEYPSLLREVLRTQAGARMAVGTLLEGSSVTSTFLLQIAECLREKTFGPMARSGAKLSSGVSWSDLAGPVKEAALQQLHVFDVSTADGVDRLGEAVVRVSKAMGQRLSPGPAAQRAAA